MIDLVEHIAKAIYLSRNGAGCKPWSIQPKAHKQPYLEDARAAIDAIGIAGYALSSNESNTGENHA